MSTAIGIGFQSQEENSLIKELEALADEYDYGVERKLENAEDDMKSGLSDLFVALGWDSLILLKTPKDNSAVLAFDIQEDLRSWECEGLRPKFYDFLLSVSLLLTRYCKEFYVFFSGEWYEGDRIRMEQGYIEDLLLFLRKPANWNEKLYVPKSKSYQYSDEVPLVYKVKVRGG